MPLTPVCLHMCVYFCLIPVTRGRVQLKSDTPSLTVKTELKWPTDIQMLRKGNFLEGNQAVHYKKQ